MVDKKKDSELKLNDASGTDSSSKTVKNNKSDQVLKNNSSSSDINKPDNVDKAKMSDKKSNNQDGKQNIEQESVTQAEKPKNNDLKIPNVEPNKALEKKDLSKKNESKTKGLKKQENANNSTKSKNSNNRDRNNVEENEFIEKLVSINRVAKVVKGGRRFSFAALVVVGDGNGRVGHGKGKAKEVPEAIKKATDEAKVRMIRVPLRQGRTLHHDISGSFDSGKVYLRSAPSGTGVIAGGPMRAVFEALGIQDIVAKSVGSSNPHNMIRATFQALNMASSPKLIAIRRGLKINDIIKRRNPAQNKSENVQDG